MRFARHKIFQIKRLEISHIHKIASLQSLIGQRSHESGRGFEIIHDTDL